MTCEYCHTNNFHNSQCQNCGAPQPGPTYSQILDNFQLLLAPPTFLATGQAIWEDSL